MKLVLICEGLQLYQFGKIKSYEHRAMQLADVVTAAQEGDKEAFDQLVIRFQDMAYASAYAITGDSELAQDAAQEAFLDAYQNLAHLREPAAFPG